MASVTPFFLSSIEKRAAFDATRWFLQRSYLSKKTLLKTKRKGPVGGCMRRLTCTIAIALSALWSGGCGGSSSAQPPIPPVTVAVSPKTPTVASGATQQFTAVVSNASNTTVTWTASSGTVTATGLFTAPTVTANTEVTVTATLIADNTKSDFATVTVTPPKPTITGVTTACNPTSVQSGQTSQCVATVSGTGNYSSAVTWIATPGTMNTAGLYTAPTVTAIMHATITATSVQDASKSNSVAVTVTPPPPTITTVTVVPDPASVQVNQTMQFRATVTGTGSFNPSVTWSASAGTISPSGLFTAPATAGNTVVTATSVQDTTKSGSASVAVTTIPVVAVAVSPKTSTVISGGTEQFNAIVTGSSNTAVTWTTSVGTITQTGLFTAPVVTTSTTVIVAATSVADTSKSDSVTVTVTPPPPTITGVTTVCNPTSVQSGQTSQCAATVSGTGSYSSTVTWTASAGTITQTGLFTAPTVATTATASVIATSVQDPTKSGTTKITVNPPPANLTFAKIPDIPLSVLGQKITPVDMLPYVTGGTLPFTFAVTAQTSSDSVVASISGTLLTSDYGYHAGTNTVTVTVTDANSKTAKTNVNIIVTPPSVAYRPYGIDYGPYVGSQNPNYGAVVGEDQLIQQIGAIAPYTQGIRTFGCTNGLQDVAKIVKRFGLKVFVGMWISSDPTASMNEITSCIAAAQATPVDAALVGSEALLRNDVTAAQLTAYINEFRAAVPNVPVSTGEIYSVLENNPAVVAACDFIFVNYYPFWEGTDITTAVASLHAEDALLRATYAPKEVIVSETGWQSFGTPVSNAVPSPQNAAYYFLNFESWAQAGQRKTFYFEDHDEPWKNTDDGWGIWDQNLVMKPGMMDVFNGVTIPDNWTCNAIPGGSGTPALVFTSVPPLGSSALLQGQEWHVVPANYYVVVYIHVGGGWWVKPYAASPLTIINCDGTWSTDIVTGGNDAQADQITAFLIPTSYSPPVLLGAGALPAELYTNSVANTSASR